MDAVDLDLAKRNPENSLERRSVRVLDEEIARLERQLSGLRFVRETLLRHIQVTGGIASRNLSRGIQSMPIICGAHRPSCTGLSVIKERLVWMINDGPHFRTYQDASGGLWFTPPRTALWFWQY